jgi:hypothetical protein
MVENLDRVSRRSTVTGKFKLGVPYRRQLDFEKRLERIEERLGWGRATTRKPAVPAGDANAFAGRTTRMEEPS